MSGFPMKQPSKKNKKKSASKFAIGLKKRLILRGKTFSTLKADFFFTELAPKKITFSGCLDGKFWCFFWKKWAGKPKVTREGGCYGKATSTQIQNILKKEPSPKMEHSPSTGISGGNFLTIFLKNDPIYMAFFVGNHITKNSKLSGLKIHHPSSLADAKSKGTEF